MNTDIEVIKFRYPINPLCYLIGITMTFNLIIPKFIPIPILIPYSYLRTNTNSTYYTSVVNPTKLNTNGTLILKCHGEPIAIVALKCCKLRHKLDFKCKQYIQLLSTLTND